MKKKLHNPKIIFIYICAIIGVLGMEAGGLQYNLMLICEELGLSTTQLGNLASMQYIAFILIPVVFGGLGDKYGKKLVMILFGISFSLGGLSIILSEGFFLVAAGIFLMGAGYSMCESTGTSLLSDMFHEDSSRYINWSQSCFSIGALISPLLSQYLVDVVGLNWRVFFAVLMVSYIVFAIWAATLKFPETSEDGHKSGETISGQKKKMESSVKVKMTWLVVAMTLYAGMESGIAFFIGTHVSHVLGTDALNSMALSTFWLLMIPSRYLAGVLKNQPKNMLKLCFLFSAVSIGLLTMMTTKNMLLIMYALIGFFMGPLWPLIMGQAGNLDPSNSAKISGMMIAFCGIGGMVSPTVFGWFADNFSLNASLFFVMSITLAGFAAIMIYARLCKKERN